MRDYHLATYACRSIVHPCDCTIYETVYSDLPCDEAMATQSVRQLDRQRRRALLLRVRLSHHFCYYFAQINLLSLQNVVV